MRSLEQVNIRTNVRTYVLTYIRTGQTLYPLHNFVVRGDKNDFPYYKKIVVRCKKIGYNINVMRQTACLVVNPIKVNTFAYLFNCTTVGRTSED